MPYVFVHCCLLDISEQFRAVERSLDPEGPGKRPAADRLIETERGGVYIRAPAGQRTAWIREASTLDLHDAQQIALGRSLPASHTGSLRAGAGVRPARHLQVYLPAPTSPLRGNGRTLAGQKDSVDRRAVRGAASPHVAGTGDPGRSWPAAVDRDPRWPTGAVGRPDSVRPAHDGATDNDTDDATVRMTTVRAARGLRPTGVRLYETVPRRTVRAPAPYMAPCPPLAHPGAQVPRVRSCRLVSPVSPGRRAATGRRPRCRPAPRRPAPCPGGCRCASR